MNLVIDDFKEFESLKECPETKFTIKPDEKSVLFIVDMNNGFAKEGSLYSERVEQIIPEIVEITKLYLKNQLPVIAFTDCHPLDSVEFTNYPPHCLENTPEAEVVDELKILGDKLRIIKKNSTNGFLEKEAREVIDSLAAEGCKKWIITGCCTDICILQFALTLKTYFNTQNIESEIIVPISAVETYDAPWHNGDAMNLFALYNMQMNGIKIVGKIDMDK